MAKQESGFKANIGSSSLILIFIVMCLVTFGMLSLTSAKSDLSLANRNAQLRSITGPIRKARHSTAWWQGK